jgi:hypothetical protein
VQLPVRWVAEPTRVVRQLGRLTRPLTGAGSSASAIAVYAEPSGTRSASPLTPRSAREQGLEGVACVDDAARAIVLYAGLWHRFHIQFARTAAARLLRFLAHMQDDDGRFGNFILDWSGRRNRTGKTSRAGGPAWQARALHALACGSALFTDGEWDERFRRAVPGIDAGMPYLDVRAVGVLAMLEHWRATAAAESADRAITWSREIAHYASGSSLPNAAGVQSIHLWGHLQEAALAETGAQLSQPDLVECARASAEAVLLPAVDSGFHFERVLPFDVSCAIAGLASVARATSNERYATAAARGRAWFHGRNTAAQPVYDAWRGRVYDGIDDGHVSRNSGAESNIEGALGLLSYV